MNRYVASSAASGALSVHAVLVGFYNVFRDFLADVAPSNTDRKAQSREVLYVHFRGKPGVKQLLVTFRFVCLVFLLRCDGMLGDMEHISHAYVALYRFMCRR